MVFLVSQGALGYWVNYLFSGFLVAKTPFPLTFRFKSMLQRGVEVENLEAGYISGLCWYFMIMMGISGIQQFIKAIEAHGMAKQRGKGKSGIHHTYPHSIITSRPRRHPLANG